MKKTLVRLLSVILAAVMIFPAAAFATDEVTPGTDPSDPKEVSIALFVKETQALPDAPSEVSGWYIKDEGIISISNGEVTGVKAGNTVARAMSGYDMVGPIYNITVKEPEPTGISVTPPTKTKYYSGESIDLTGLVVKVNYEYGESKVVTTGYSVDPVDSSLNTSILSAGTHIIKVTYGSVGEDSFTITVDERKPTSIKILDTKTKYEVGDSFLGIQVLVNYNYGEPDILVSGYEVSPETATKGVTSYTVTYHGLTDTKTGITVTDKSGSGSGGGTTPVDDTKLKASVSHQPKNKSYKVGEAFDTTDMEVRMLRTDNSVYVTLSDADLARYISYTFKDTDVTASGKTKSLTFTFIFEGKEYSVTVDGFTCTVPKKTLSVKTSGSSVRNILVEMKNKHYPVGTTIGLSDIYRISGYDANDKEFIYYYPETLEFGNISLEVASVNNRGETSRKSASGRSRIDSGDIYTKSTDEKVVYLRLYVDDTYYHEFPVNSGDPAVSVYTSSAYSSSYQIGTFDDLAEALDYVNDVNYQWGSTSASVYAASRTLYIRLAEDADLNRYYVIPARNFEIDLNGHKLTMYTDSFRFRDRYDTYTATLSNTSSTTAKVSYTDLPADDLLVPLLDKNEKIVFKYQDSATANAPGIYTVTIAEIKEGGTVTAKPAASTRNNVTTVTIAHGNDITFTVTPAKDFQIDTVKSKAGTSAEQTVSVSTNKEYSVSANTGVATYTMKDIKADTILTAAFKAVKKEEEKKEEKPADTPWTNPFTDVRSTASYYDAVKYVNQNGLMDGMTTTSFGPDRTMTRAQFVTVLGRMFLGSLGVPNLETTNQKYESMLGTYGTISQFTDVSNDDPTLKNWAVPYIIWAEKEGLVQGLGNGKFDPQGPITHQQMYIIMYRYAQYIAHQSINAATLPDLRATDANKIGEGWLSAAKEGAIAAAKYAQQQNFLVSTVVIDPAGFAVRSELATLLMQFSKNVLGWN